MRKPVYCWVLSLAVGLLSYATFTFNHSVWNTSLWGSAAGLLLAVTSCLLFGYSVEKSFQDDEFTTEIDHKRISSGMWILMTLLAVAATIIFLAYNTASPFYLTLLASLPAVLVIMKMVQKVTTMITYLRHYSGGLPNETEAVERLQSFYQGGK